MTFKFYSFVPGDDSELNYARPGSPPAFFSLPSPVSPRGCGNCFPSITAGAIIAASTADSTLKDRSLQPIDAGLHDLRSRVMRALAVVNKVQGTSLDSQQKVRDCIVDLNREIMKVILDWLKSWKNQELSDIAIKSNLQILEFCLPLDDCLASAWYTQLPIQVALGKCLNSFRDKLDELILYAERCGGDVWRQRKLVLQTDPGEERITVFYPPLDRGLDG